MSNLAVETCPFLVFARGFPCPAFAVACSHLGGRHLARHMRQAMKHHRPLAGRFVPRDTPAPQAMLVAVRIHHTHALLSDRPRGRTTRRAQGVTLQKVIPEVRGSRSRRRAGRAHSARRGYKNCGLQSRGHRPSPCPRRPRPASVPAHGHVRRASSRCPDPGPVPSPPTMGQARHAPWLHAVL